MSKILLIGFGNPGRLDDGLGPALADAVEKEAILNITVESDYQLTVEDSVSISQHDIVIFADASVENIDSFYFEKIQPSEKISFSSHSISPHDLLALTKDIFGKTPTGYILGIKGYEFNGFGETLSEKARLNLQTASEFIIDKLKEYQL